MGLFAALLWAPAARAQAPEPSCRGCLLQPVDGAAPAPLLVVLHGDEGSPAKVFAAWRAVARERGVVLFAPRCPREEGCDGSWWRWGREPAWLFSRVDELAGIEPSRRYVTGWSGGASYLGMFAARWSERFAGLSLAGGGVAPAQRGCDPCPPPVHYLAGDRNPLHALAVDARDHLLACGHRVEWQLLAGRTHEGEWRAYADGATQRQILAQLLASRACAPPSLPLTAPSASGSVAPLAIAPHEPRATPAAAPRAHGCGCQLAAVARPPAVVLFAALGAIRIAAAGSHRRRRATPAARALRR